MPSTAQPMAAATPVLWAPFGAAFMALNEPQRAVPFFHRKAREANAQFRDTHFVDAAATYHVALTTVEDPVLHYNLGLAYQKIFRPAYDGPILLGTKDDPVCTEIPSTKLVEAGACVKPGDRHFAECGVANSIAGVLAGATQVQATMNGVGERTGNANMTALIPNLQLKLGRPVVTEEQLALLTPTAHFLDELLNRTPDPQSAYVGKLAFTHKGGLHAAGVRADASTFEHVRPEQVGNTSDVLVSELAGRHAVHDKAAGAGVDIDDTVAARVIERVKQLEHLGYQFEAADGSLELLMRREAGVYEPLFTLESWRVIVEQRADGKVDTEATVKIWLDGERYVRTAEGNGPVNALDNALRSAIVEIHPHLRDIELVNYKVRILDAEHGTQAVTRVLIDASDGTDVWGTIGVGENVIAASWQALVDSLERAEQPGRRAAARRPDQAATTPPAP